MPEPTMQQITVSDLLVPGPVHIRVVLNDGIYTAFTIERRPSGRYDVFSWCDSVNTVMTKRQLTARFQEAAERGCLILEDHRNM